MLFIISIMLCADLKFSFLISDGGISIPKVSSISEIALTISNELII
ncbi:MAG: hypothetical protein SPI60_02500 [Campylobacter lanienae]|nr:hypothetical protein [Campylobacter lanienae]